MARPAQLLVDEDRFGTHAEAMVNRQLAARGIADRRVLEAMRTVPRHCFISEELADRAYEDGALPTMHGQTISQPYMVAAMTEAMALAPRHRVLEIGTGSGYQLMILARLARHVVSIERDAELAERGRQQMERFGATHTSIHVGDGSLGWPDEAPYDRIMVTAGAPDVPPALLEQLADGGRVVIPVGDRELQYLMLVDRRGNDYRRTRSIGCRFVPLLGAQGWRESPTE